MKHPIAGFYRDWLVVRRLFRQRGARSAGERDGDEEWRDCVVNDLIKQIAKIIITDAKAVKFGSDGGWISSASAEFCAREILDHIRENPVALQSALDDMRIAS
jgi:hypothetical protein